MCRSSALRVLTVTAAICLSAAPARAETVWLYDVTGSGFRFVNGDYTGQEVPISGTAAIGDLLANWEKTGDFDVRGSADFDLEFMGSHLSADDVQLRSRGEGVETYQWIAGVFFTHVAAAGPALPPRWWEDPSGLWPDSSYAGPMFVGHYRTEPPITIYGDWYSYVLGIGGRPAGDAPLWPVGDREGLFARRITLSNPRLVPDPGSSLLLLSIGLLGLKAGTGRMR